MFSRQVTERSGNLKLTGSSESQAMQGYIYCAARSILRASQSVDSAREMDYLFSAMANLEQLGRALHIADADVAEIGQWAAELEGRLHDLRRRGEFSNRIPQPMVQIDASVLIREDVREIA